MFVERGGNFLLRNGDWRAGIMNEEAQRFRKRVRIREHLKSGIGHLQSEIHFFKGILSWSERI
jgi:hypothetical protein